MKKLLSWGFAAAMICGLNVFSSCINDNDDNPVDPADHLAEKIIGKWMIAAVDGQRSTNGKGGVSDMQKVLQLQNEMAHARRNYADQATIEGYTRQLNELVKGQIPCELLGRFGNTPLS